MGDFARHAHKGASKALPASEPATEPLTDAAAPQTAEFWTPVAGLVRRAEQLVHEAQVVEAVAVEPSGGVLVGKADDPAEHEADAVASEVVKRLRNPSRESSALGDVSAVDGGVQRRATGDADPLGGHVIGGDVLSTLQRRQGGGSALPGPVAASMGEAFGADFSKVRVHTDGEAAAVTRQVQAEAFTHGSDIYFGKGRFSPSTESGQTLLAHELTHVVQQGQGVQRKYLDGQVDWTADSKATGMFGWAKGRSDELKDVDAEVAKFPGLYAVGDVPKLIAGAQAIVDAITAWRSTKKDPAKALRGPQVLELRSEALEWVRKASVWISDFGARKALHEKDRKTVNSWVDEGLAQKDDVRLRNACEWIRSGKAQFYVVTETLDSHDRGAALTKKKPADVDSDMICYFPNELTKIGDLMSPPALYNPRNFRDATNVTADDQGRGTKGWNRAGQHVVVTQEGVADGKAAVWETLRHEVQHDADRHQGTELGAGVAAAKALPKSKANKAKFKAAQALQGYKTEYRAHFYQADPALDKLKQDEKKKITKLGFKWTDRQWEIFSQIKRNYDYVEAAWGDDKDLAPKDADTIAFRRDVVAYCNPDTEGFNKYDSIRIDDLYLALDKVPDGTSDVDNPLVQALLVVAKRLKADDSAYLLDPAQSVMFNKKIKKHLAGAALAALNAIISGRGKSEARAAKPKALTPAEETDNGQAIAGLFA